MSDTRDQIAIAAAKAVQKGGIHSVSFRTLAQEVGVKSSSVHYHFPTKPHLTQALVDTYTESFRLRLAAISLREQTILGRLDSLIDVFEEVLIRDDLCLCGMMAAELDSLDENTHTALKRFFKISEDWLVDVAQAHQGSLSMAPAELAKVFMAGLEGAILLDRVTESRDRLNAFRTLARTVAV